MEKECPIEVVIIIGGDRKGTRFRPLSLNLPKPLFPIAGIPLVEHLIKQCIESNKYVCGINLLGFYELDDRLSAFIKKVKDYSKIPIRYLQESSPMGTAGGLLYFKDRIMASQPKAILFINGDVFLKLPLNDFVNFYLNDASCQCSLLVTELSEDMSLDYGCVAIDKSGKVQHYVEKPRSFVSSTVNCGIYLLDPLTIFDILNQYKENTNQPNRIQMESNVFPALVSQKKLFAYRTTDFWGSIKTPSSIFQANKKYLEMMGMANCVYSSKTALIDESALIGPNVSIGDNVKIGKGVRIRDAIIVGDCEIGDHSCILMSIIGSSTKVGKWCRIEGVKSDGAIANMSGVCYDHNNTLKDVTVIGHDVKIADEIIIRCSIVLPHKDINRSCKSEIVL